ncbi:hypothetical protein EY329_09125 [Shigella sonnei]|nr:ash family protein [Escherichia coli]EFW0524053.1 ash family protein [Shigella sonnei]EIO6875913.1 ash family protein [Shigella flexneri]HBN4613743.1 ash family protein [Escherichia coli O25b:H4-ST131]EFW9054841.1 hypothetical protein [Shigella sonnei]
MPQPGVRTRISQATHNTRQRVFLCVYKPAHIRIMVAQAGQPKGWPVSFGPVFSPPSGLPPP